MSEPDFEAEAWERAREKVRAYGTQCQALQLAETDRDLHNMGVEVTARMRDVEAEFRRMYKAGRASLLTEALPPEPRCRDCADARVEGVCDWSGLPCDPYERLTALARKGASAPATVSPPTPTPSEPEGPLV